MNHIDERFRVAMREAGLDFAGPLLPDGKLHRFRAVGDKGRASWYVLHAGPPAVGVFGSWRGTEKQTWHDRNGERLSQAERDAIRLRVAEAEAERKRVEDSRQRKARKIARWILSRSKPAEPSHAYLAAKRVQPHGELHQWRGKLVIPLRDDSGELRSLQFIGTDGSKLFLSGGRVAGCFFALPDTGTGVLILAEGYATAASIHEATGCASIAAMNCGNLSAVAKALRAKWPQREIIIAGDNDAFTDGNPGRTKATNAAKASRALLAIPAFKDTTTKPSDYNDLMRLEGVEAVKEQIKAATAPKETDEEALERLAGLSPMEFDRCVQGEAEALGISVSTLRSEVARRRENPVTGTELQGQALELADVELWPQSVNGPDVLNAIAETLTKYVVLPPGGADAIALWIAHAHAFRSFLHTPRLNIKSPEKRCGKTTLRDVLATLVPKPLPTENLSTAVLFRVVDKYQPTLLADEYDSWLPDNEDLRGMLNAGHQRGGQALRCVGDDFEPRAFRVFAPVVLAGIGSLPGTLLDRSIVIKMVRAKPGELTVGFDSRRIQTETELCQKLARWCVDHAEQLEVTDPIMPGGAFNRLANNWRPLFAIAEVAGGDWPQRAASAFALLTAQEHADEQGIGTMLLGDIRTVFEQSHTDKIFSKQLIESLIAMSDRPWGEIRKGKAISENWLGRHMRGFGVTSRKIRIGEDVRQGYVRDDFAEVWERYLDPEGDSKQNTGTNAVNNGPSEDSKTEHAEPVFHFETTQKTNTGADCSTVPPSKPPGEDQSNELLV